MTGFVIYKGGDNKESRVSHSLKVLIHGLLKLILEVKLIRGIAATHLIYIGGEMEECGPCLLCVVWHCNLHALLFELQK